MCVAQLNLTCDIMVRFWYRRKLFYNNSSDIQQNNLGSEQEN